MMSDPINTMLDALNAVGSAVKKSGTGWSCRCPAHNDKHPSLSIGIGEESRVLLNCHAGCETKVMTDPRPLMNLPELTNLPDGAWVYIVEGESCFDAARAIGLVATTSAGGSKAAAKTDWSVLKNKVAASV